MKNYLIIGLLCLVAALIVGIEPVQRVINEAMNRGTLRGVETCMDYTGSELVSGDAIKATCVQAFQKRLYSNDYATGRAGPRVGQRSVDWGGVLENKTPDHVTTWVEISVSIYDADGIEQEHIIETPIWIDPLDETEFRVELPEVEPEQFEGIEFCDYEDEAPTGCMTWGVIGVMGLEI